MGQVCDSRARTIPSFIHTIRRVVFGALLAALTAQAGAADDDALIVFAAASTTDAIAAAAAAFTEATGTPVALSFASSGALARQIELGAPADLYLAANPVWMDVLEAGGLLAAGTRRAVASNRLVLIAPSSDAPEPAGDIAGTLFMALGESGRLAIGDPAHVPAGFYARQTLEALGLWDALESRLARTADVRGAQVLVARAEAPAGIVYATDVAITPDVTALHSLPADSHEPIVYPAAIVAERDSPAARAFLDFLTGEDGQRAFAEAGFLPAP